MQRRPLRPRRLQTTAVAFLILLIALPPGAAGEPDGGDAGWSSLDDAEIRPGVSIAGFCTAGFVLTSTTDPSVYIATASHCVGGLEPGDTVPIGDRPDAGTLVYCSWMHTEETTTCPASDFMLHPNDFALVEIREDLTDRVHPAVIHWGGPTSMGDPLPPMTKVHSYGTAWFNPLKELNRMEGYTTFSNQESTFMYTLRPGVFGDSGAPVIEKSGAAVGLIVAVNILTGQTIVANLKNALEYMESETGLQVELATWSPLNDGVLL